MGGDEHVGVSADDGVGGLGGCQEHDWWWRELGQWFPEVVRRSPVEVLSDRYCERGGEVVGICKTGGIWTGSAVA